MCTSILGMIAYRRGQDNSGDDTAPEPRQGDRAYSQARKDIIEEKLASEAQTQACIEWLIAEITSWVGRRWQYSDDEKKLAYDLDGQILLLLEMEANFKPLQLAGEYRLLIIMPSTTGRGTFYSGDLFLSIGQGR